MDHALTEGQQLLQRTAADFFAKEFPLDRIRDFRLDPEGSQRELWQQIGAMGWNGAAFPEEIGGYPGSFMEAAVILEQIGLASAPTPFAHSTLAAGLTLAAAGDALAGEIAASNATAVAVPSAPGLDIPDTGGDAVTGDCWAVPWAGLATHYLVPDGDGLALIGAADGVTVRPASSTGLEPRGVVHFQSAPVLGRFGAEAALAVQLNGAAATAMVMAGASARALDVAVAYMKERIQFGKPIGAFQALQHRAADMAIQSEVSRYLAFKAASLHGSDAFERSARYAKAYTSEASQRVCREAIQMHGGVGFIDEHKVQLPYRLCSDLSNAYGGPGVHRGVAADLALAASAR